jgi:hypothetical protein
MLGQIVRTFSAQARARRGAQFLALMGLEPHHRVLDLGGGDGGHFHAIAPGHKNVLVADHSAADLARAREQFGYQTTLLDGAKESLPFEDRAFDIVFCSSVIEHVTGPKAEMVAMNDAHRFAEIAWRHQTRFAAEVRRVANGYFVQTPNRGFPIEPHSMLPQPVIHLPRRAQRDLMRAIAPVWIAKVQPDWNLLDQRQMGELFPDAELLLEKAAGFVKSITAARRRSAAG